LWICISLLAGFAVRLWQASGTFLNPDEAMHFLVANQASWKLTYEASLSLAHPPLLILLLHAWRSLGTSEITLRVPSILLGTAFCWLLYKWVATLFGDSVAWIAFLLALFLPSTIDFSIEVRQYALFLALAMASAYLLERALDANSAPAMLFSALSLWLAMCSHYSALLFAGGFGLYAVFRMVARRPPRKIFALWAAGQAGAVALGAFFYMSHISRLSQISGTSGIIQGWGSSYLPNSYYVPGRINPLLFIFARTGGVFQYAFGQAVVGDLALVAFVLGIFLVFRQPGRQPGLSRVQANALAVLFVLPFTVGCTAAMTRLYPYGGTRHSAFLLPFVLAGVSLALAHLLKYRLASGIAVAIAVALLCNLFPAHRQPYVSRADQSLAKMNAAVDFMQHQIAPNEIIFTDSQSGLLVEHYLCDHRIPNEDHSMPGFISFDCGGHRVIVTDWKTSYFTPRSFYDPWQILAAKYDLQPGSRVWITQMGWSTDLAGELERFPEFHLAPHFFGNRIQIFDLTVGQSMPDPKLLPTS
jgi:hypothetical protein